MYSLLIVFATYKARLLQGLSLALERVFVSAFNRYA